MTVAESTVEDAALAWLEELGYAVLRGSEIEPEKPERVGYHKKVIARAGSVGYT